MTMALQLYIAGPVLSFVYHRCARMPIGITCMHACMHLWMLLNVARRKELEMVLIVPILIVPIEVSQKIVTPVPRKSIFSSHNPDLSCLYFF